MKREVRELLLELVGAEIEGLRANIKTDPKIATYAWTKGRIALLDEALDALLEAAK